MIFLQKILVSLSKIRKYILKIVFVVLSLVFVPRVIHSLIWHNVIKKCYMIEKKQNSVIAQGEIIS